MTAPQPRFRDTPPPLGVRAAAVKMAIIVAETDKGEPLTETERKIVTAVGMFLGEEYERISANNDDMTRQLADLSARLLDIHRLSDTAPHVVCTCGANVGG